MNRLNYHHLYYFWHVAKSGNLTQSAQELHTSQSALSSQIKQLEHTMDVNLFERKGRRLILTQQGQQALILADDIFSKGEELASLLKGNSQSATQPLRIGVMSVMSRNFIEAFISPLLQRQDVQFTLLSKGITNLLNELSNHKLDVVLSNVNVAVDAGNLWQVQLLGRQPLSIVGPPDLLPKSEFPQGYKDFRWVVPGKQSEIRASFDAFCSHFQFEPNIQTQVDDMAMLRLLARDSGSLAVLPKVVVKDELSAGSLIEYLSLPKAFEHFYAITVKRSKRPPILDELLAKSIFR
ncbi:LysR family transcriptional regulator [Paraglaciecola sp.]|uniref:LysR family transcriptional regulator n=1 Tax=Paraglaciecola sp. TaxID=1920173 RepID=UPI00273EA2BD|nr:LysR family transcriptional regulator [Paraglaciecola sp.]MDP5032636.1 LysR family transcriptional regulator [Paraglaciecola sp.]